jgi:hypothetical protein
MFKFLKSLFGGDKELNKEAGVQIEQVPYKVEPPVVEDKVAVANAQPIEKSAPKAESKPAVITAEKKPAAKKAAARKPAAKKAPAKKKSTK